MGTILNLIETVSDSVKERNAVEEIQDIPAGGCIERLS